MSHADDAEQDISDAEHAKERAYWESLYLAEKGKPIHAPKIELVELLDLIDDCNWGEWACRYSLDNGQTWTEGSVQSDGHLIAKETLTDDAGNLIQP